ncbi:MAG TPA: SAM-dependent methyltransferase, partial [Acidimicrobiia bacterium]|nr:SAM-dependent methyltransferase [Acidimicrobiia bacterium]
MTTGAETAGFMAMKGSGYYSKVTVSARQAIDAATPWVLEVVDRLPLDDDGPPVRVADLGCADGGTSIGLWHRVLSALRQQVPGRAIEIVYTDLPKNDFSQLFRMLHGQTEIESYYGQIPDVYPFASATSFHEAIFPPASVHLAFSAHANHYISKVPCPIAEHVHMVGATEAERAAYEDAGRVEWERLLALRARELVPGGRLCMMSFGIDDNGHHIGHTGGVRVFDTFNTLWRQLADEGVIS